MLVKKQLPPNGNTAQLTKLIKNVKIGAKIKLNVFEFVGITASLTNNFRPSANGCNKPKKPTEFGPKRCCIAPITLRSANVKYAIQISAGTTKTRNEIKISNKNITKINKKNKFTFFERVRFELTTIL
jgi:hypothetical protein